MSNFLDSAHRIAQEVSPCDDCAHISRCEHEQLACQSFAIYIVKEGRLDIEKREPSRIIFDSLFRDEKENRRGPMPKAIMGSLNELL